MKIRNKIILTVLPLIASALIITGTISALAARSGLSRIAMKFLGFKSQELEKYIDNQWNLLVSNNLDTNPEYVAVTKSAIRSYADTLVRSGSELIFALDENITLVMSTNGVEILPTEDDYLRQIFNEKKQGWVEFPLGDIARVGDAFFYEPFNWLFFVTDEREMFYKEVTEITYQTGYILIGALVASIILLIAFSSYLTRPLKTVVGTMRDIISKNDLSERVEVQYEDEIGNLAHTFNIMVNELEKAYQQIKGFALSAVIARKNEHKIRNIFQKYVPKDVIDSFFKNPESMLVGENRVMVILFSDIRSFTTISEGFMPDELVNALNKYFETMVDIIMSHNGIIDKYIGDAIMAFFGAPVKRKDDAAQAVAAAIEMQEALVIFNKEQINKGKPAFNTGIGINYGVVTVGNIGSEKKMDYTIIGDMVNLGSRLEGLTKPYKQTIIFSESVFHKVKSVYPCRLVDKVVVKGKTQGEKIFTAKRTLTKREKEAWALHHKALRHYYQKNFPEAIKYFQGVQKFLPDDYISQMFLGRCERYLENPPPIDWNGLEILTSK